MSGAKLIPLCYKKDPAAKFVIVDAEDYERLMNESWHYNPTGSTSGYARSGKGKYLHRIIMGDPEGKEIDHIDHDTLDCRKENLRICNRSQNTFNHPKRKTNTSGHVGVWFGKQSQRWHAEIMINYKKIQLGTFKEKEDAINARVRAEKDLYKDFERTK